MSTVADAPLKRLEVLVGRWKTEGWTRATVGMPAERIDAIDTYEWLVEGVAMLHRVDARVGDLKVDGAESSASTPSGVATSPSISEAMARRRTRRTWPRNAIDRSGRCAAQTRDSPASSAPTAM